MMRKFEYKIIPLLSRDQAVSVLNGFGAQGWRVIHIDSDGILLMREVAAADREVHAVHPVRGPVVGPSARAAFVVR